MKKRIGAITGFSAFGVVAILAIVFAITSNASAQVSDSPDLQSLGVVSAQVLTNATSKTVSYISDFWPGFPGNGGNDQQYLANALGISLQDLQTAQQNAFDAAVQHAVDQGLITQDQADNMILRGGFGGRNGFKGNLFGPNSGIDYNALLAKELGISVSDLQAAQKKAQSDMLAQAVQNGTITQEQADLIQARQALQSYINPQAILARALGITTDQLQAYQDQGMTISQILNKVGMTAVQVRDAEQAAYQAAVQQAVTDGVITQSQADQFLSSGYPGGFRGGFFGGFEGFRGGGFGGRHGGGFKGFGNRNASPTPTPGSGI